MIVVSPSYVVSAFRRTGPSRLSSMRKPVVKLAELLDRQPGAPHEIENLSLRGAHAQRLFHDAVGDALGNHQQPIDVAVQQVPWPQCQAVERHWNVALAANRVRMLADELVE